MNVATNERLVNLRNGSAPRIRFFLATTLLLLAGCASTQHVPASFACRNASTPMSRVELLFSHPEPTATETGDQLLTRFLDQEVSPRFPEGFTLHDVKGQWRGPDGRIDKSNSHVLVIWYKPSATAESSIEIIRNAYKKNFSQISVMRVDGEDCVAF